MRRILSVLFILINATIGANASSVFFLNTQNDIFVAKSFGANNGVGYLIVNPRGYGATAIPTKGPFMSWKSRYGSVTFNQLSKNMPIGGINEEGLVVEMINSSEMSEQNHSADIYLNEFEVVKYLLDNCKNTSEAVRAVKRIKIEVFSTKAHYLIADKFSRTAIVEYVAGDVVVIDESSESYVPILTANRFSKSLESAMGEKIKNNRGDSKFTYIYKVMDTLSNISVEKIYDVMRNTSEDDSKWNIVYDIKGEKVYFNTLSSPVVKEIDLGEIDFGGSAQMYIDINKLLIPKCNSELSPIDEQSHINLVMNGFEGSQIAFFDNNAKEYLASGNRAMLQGVINKRAAKLGVLKVSVSNLDSDRGVVRMFLYDSDNGFSKGKYVRSEVVHVEDEMAVAYFYNLPKDKYYALYYSHDENTNNKTDRQWVGLPKESFGYSGEGGGSFDDAKFKFGNLGVKHCEIIIRNFLFW